MCFVVAVFRTYYNNPNQISKKKLKQKIKKKYFIKMLKRL